MDTVRHNARMIAAEQAETVISVAVEFCVRTKLFDPFNLSEVFGKMALQRKRILRKYRMK